MSTSKTLRAIMLAAMLSVVGAIGFLAGTERAPVRTLAQQSAQTRAGARPHAGKQLVIYYVGLLQPSNSFFAEIARGAQDAGRDLGATVHYIAPAQFSVPAVVDEIHTAIAAHPDGIAMNLADPTAQIPVAQQAVAAGIPVAAGDSVPDQKAKNDPFLVYAGSNETLAGQLAAQYMLAHGKVTRAVCAIHQAGNAPLEQRCAGFISVLQGHGIPVDKLSTSTDPTIEENAFQAYFTRHPDANALLTLCSSQCADIALHYMATSHRKLMLGSFDLDPTTLQAIAQGTMLFDVDQQQYLRGYIPVWWLVMHARYKFNPVKDFLTGPNLVTKAGAMSVLQLSAQGYR